MQIMFGKNFSDFKLLNIQFLFVIFILSMYPSYLLSQEDIYCYVWDFYMRNGIENSLTESITIEFEEILIKQCNFRVLERRRFNRLVSQIDNEITVSDINNVSSQTLDSLKFYQANAVFFGDIYDDIESGDFKITITLQFFNSDKKVYSKRMRRGLRNDAEMREGILLQIVQEFCSEYSNLNIQINDSSSNRDSTEIKINETDLNDKPLKTPNVDSLNLNNSHKNGDNLNFNGLENRKNSNIRISGGFLSMLPGMGQFRKQEKKKGWVFIGLESIFISSVIISDNYAKSTYRSAENTTYQSERDYYLNKHENYKTINTLSWIFLIITHSTNTIDALNYKELNSNFALVQSLMSNFNFRFFSKKETLIFGVEIKI